MSSHAEKDENNVAKDFIRQRVAADVAAKKNDGKVVTRFPPEPNGYLHIGHAKSICLNFGIAEEFEGICHLRFDDTNPTKEEVEYVDSIQRDVKWLGFDWHEKLFYASDYFEQFYEYAIELIKKDKAYVCHLTPEQVREYRGSLTEPGKESPYRNRSVEENLELLEKMKNGEFADNECTLRAKIDMASPNINLRDPAIYRIRNFPHHRTGDKWCIYPMYDFAHGLSDSIEGITHSICTLEFENHRPLYDWFLEQLDVPCHPQQIEFARFNLTHTIMSKRKLLRLVQEKYVDGWDDPRMPTLSGIRRRGYSPESIRNFCAKIGVSKHESTTEVNLLEHCVREDLNQRALRVMGVLNPLKVVIENYPEDKEEEIEAPYFPWDASKGSRIKYFSNEVYIDRNDFMIDPPKKYFRMAPGREVRLRYGYYVTCKDYKVDEKTGEVTEVICTYDPESKGGTTPDGRKVKGALHWVSAKHAHKAEARLYEHLFEVEDPEEEEGKDFIAHLNPNSLQKVTCYVEASLAKAQPGEYYQFERVGYFCIDSKDSHPDALVFNRTATLRESWSKKAQKK